MTAARTEKSRRGQSLHRERPSRAWYAPLILLAAFAGLSLTILWLVNSRTNTAKSDALRTATNSAAQTIRERLAGNQDYLQLLATERAAGRLSHASFRRRASQYVTDHPELICVNWVNADFLITDVAPLSGNRQVIGLRLELPQPKHASHRARATRQPVYTHPFEVIQGGLSFEDWVPVYRDGKFLGLFGGICSYERLLRHLVVSQDRSTYNVGISDDQGEVLLELPTAGPGDASLSSTASLTTPDNGGRLWFQARSRDPTDRALLLLEILCAAFMIGIVVALWRLWRQSEARRLASAEVRELNARLEDRVRERTRDLEAANRELQSFSYCVSHDLRSPLRALDGFSQILLEDNGPALDAAGRDCVTRIRAAAQHMGVLIDALLTLSRLSRQELAPEHVDITALARHIGAQLAAEQPERRVELVVADGLAASADPALLEVALRNLLANAWKFTAGNDPAHIEVGSRTVDGETVYFIADDGAGFDPAYADKLFLAFQRLHSDERFPGTGIGLATVQRAIARHGGRCWAEGQEGEGATFSFTLPLAH